MSETDAIIQLEVVVESDDATTLQGRLPLAESDTAGRDIHITTNYVTHICLPETSLPLHSLHACLPAHGSTEAR